MIKEKMKKEEQTEVAQTPLFATTAEAQAYADKAKTKNIMGLIGLALAAVATILSYLSMASGFEEEVYMFVSLPLGILSYVIGGGFGRAIKFAGKVAKFGWRILPFPTDIVTGIVSFIVATYAFLFFPVVFVFLSFRQHYKDYQEALALLGQGNQEQGV